MLEYRFVWGQGCRDFQNEIWKMIIWSDNVYKGNLFHSPWLVEFRQGKNSEGWTLNKLEYENSLNDQLFKQTVAQTFPTFCLTMSYSFFTAILWRVLKVQFKWKLLEVDYSKNIWKKENRRHGFVCLLVD